MKKAVLSTVLFLFSIIAFGQDTIRANFEWSPVCFGEESQFINKTYVPSSLGAVDYVWKFAGQGTSTNQFGKHTFKLQDSLKSEAFAVTLVVTSRTNPPDIDSVTYNADVYGLPKTWFTWDVTNDGQNQEVSIDSLAIDDDNYFYQWNLGGILKSNDKKPVFSGNELKPFVDGKNYSFTLFMRSPDGCENQYATTFMYDAVGVEELALRSDLAFPNPASGTIFLKSVYRNIELVDLSGRSVIHASNVDKIDVSMLTHGQYVLHLNDGESNSVQRIVLR